MRLEKRSRYKGLAVEGDDGSRRRPRAEGSADGRKSMGQDGLE